MAERCFTTGSDLAEAAGRAAAAAAAEAAAGAVQFGDPSGFIRGFPLWENHGKMVVSWDKMVFALHFIMNC